ncbi:unnamed protein product [Trypanosoma congolense IL3000]|uniref:WGS project CAEQ00000000 data, annotated contig 446 n=1 Tax=Trypanosoma congolense (strain IL3000) TaxID=1068625 RepID=F9WG00_TRYCI|nr:unnamed protein product [Trypanosoma congolense IL3000]
MENVIQMILLQLENDALNEDLRVEGSLADFGEGVTSILERTVTVEDIARLEEEVKEHTLQFPATERGSPENSDRSNAEAAYEELRSQWVLTLVDKITAYMLVRFAPSTGNFDTRQEIVKFLYSRGRVRRSLGIALTHITIFRSISEFPYIAADLMEEYRNGCQAQRKQRRAQLQQVNVADGGPDDGAEDSSVALLNSTTGPGEGIVPQTMSPGEFERGTLENGGTSSTTNTSATALPATLSRWKRVKFLLKGRKPALEHPMVAGVHGKSVCIGPVYPDSVVRTILDRVKHQYIYVLASFGRVCLKLSNPLPVLSICPSKFICDGCLRGDVTVAFQAVVLGGMRCRFPRSYSRGYDICVSCAVFFLHESFRELRAALLPPLYKPFNRCPLYQSHILSVERCRPGDVNDITCYDCASHDKCCCEYVRILVSLGLMTLRLYVWELSHNAAPGPVSGASVSGSGVPADGKADESSTGVPSESGSFAEQYDSLPTPPSDWKKYCSIRIATKELQIQCAVHGVCPICYEPLDSPTAIVNDTGTDGRGNETGNGGGTCNNVVSAVRTGCGHYFHAECVEAMIQMSEMPNCPMCRSEQFAVGQRRACEYEAVIRLRGTCKGNDRPTPHIAVAAMIGESYENPMSIAWCEVVNSQTVERKRNRSEEDSKVS